MSQAPPLIAGLDAAEHEAQTMSRKLCVTAALLCLIEVVVSALTNNQVLRNAIDWGMLTAVIFFLLIIGMHI